MLPASTWFLADSTSCYLGFRFCWPLRWTCCDIIPRKGPYCWRMLLGVLLLGLTISSSMGYDPLSRDPSPVIYPGQVNIGLLTSIHRPSPNGTGCGTLRRSAVLQAMAAVWAAQQVNFRKEPHELNIGIYIYDTCSLESVAMRQLYRLVTHAGHVQPSSCVDKRTPPIFASILQGDHMSLSLPIKTLESFAIPMILSSGNIIQNLSGSIHVLSTAPSVSSLARAIVNTLIRFELWDVAVIVADNDQRHLGTVFWEEAELAGIRVVTVELPAISATETPLTESMLDILDTYKVSPKAVVTLLSSEKAIKLFRNFDPEDSDTLFWLAVTPEDISEELSSSLSADQLRTLSKVMILSPNSLYIKEYHSYFRQLLSSEESMGHPLVAEFIRSGNSSFRSRPVKDPIELLDEVLAKRRGKDAWVEGDVSNTVKAVWSLAAAIKNVQNRLCRRGTDCLLYLRKTLSSYVNRATRNVAYTLHGTGASALDGIKMHFNKNGFLSTTKYVLKTVSFSEIQEVGWYSDDTGLVVDPNALAATKRFGRPDLYRNHLSQSSLRSVSLTSHQEPKINQPRFNQVPEVERELPDPSTDQPHQEIVDVLDIHDSSFASWIARPWALAVIGLSAIGILFALYVLVFLLVKMCEGTLKKSNLLLGIMQIASVLSLYGAATLLLFKPSSFMCGLQRLVPNVAYAFCFGVLLLKSMHLRSQKTIGLGGSVSNLNQVLTLSFIVGLQLALEIQRWILRPPFNIVTSEEEMSCMVSRGDVLLSQVYILILLLLVVITTLSLHNVPYNYTEGKSLIVTSIICTAVFIGWAISCWMLPTAGQRHIAASLAPISTAAAVLIGVFCPQLYAIHKYGAFPHKALSYSDSLSTVFSVFKEADQNARRGQKEAKTVDNGRTQHTKRNPAFYDDFSSAYP